MRNRITTGSDMLDRGPGFGIARSAVRASAAQRVYDHLRERIIQFDLPPGTTLSRQELATSYEVSQTPVREAILRLGEEGLVRIFPQSRTVVSRIDITQLSEAHFLRVAVETEVVRRLALKGDPGLVGEAETIVKMQRAIAGDRSAMDRFTDLDEAFHQSLFAAVNQPGLFSMLKSKTGHLARLRRLDLPSKGKSESIIADHSAIVTAIAAGDEKAAIDALRKHMTGTISSIDKLVEANPGFFST